MFNYEILSQELQLDPKELGYSRLSALATANILNLRDGVGSELIQVSKLDKNSFMLTMSPLLVAIAQKDSGLRDKWDRILSSIFSSESIVYVGRDEIKTVLSLAVSDGVVDQNTIDTFSKRLGSRAEVLFGENVFINDEQVANARKNRTSDFDGLPTAILESVDDSKIGDDKPSIRIGVRFVMPDSEKNYIRFFIFQRGDGIRVENIANTLTEYYVKQTILNEAVSLRSLFDIATQLKESIGENIISLIQGL